jgi:hypothetical protein
VALLLLAACSGDVGSAKLKSLPKAAKRAEILSTMGTGPLTATREPDQVRIVSGFRRQIFITQARQIEVLWYREEPGSLNDPITQKRETPVVVESDTLVGWGWKFYTPFAAQMKLPDPVRDSIRLDSIYKSQKVAPKPS